MSEIISVKAREILDSRGYPTIETDILLESGALGRAAVPSGKSTGKFEAVELRDGDKTRFSGKGVINAVKNVNELIAENIIGMSSEEQELIDKVMIALDGTQNKSKLGANAILSVSLAIAKATAEEIGLPLYQYIGGIIAKTLPVPQFNVLNGGAHADSGLDIQEFLILPVGFSSFKEALRAGSEIYHALEKLLKKDGYSTSIGDEGGFAPKLKNCEEAIKYILKATNEAGYKEGKEVFIGIDAAATSFYNNELYLFESKKFNSEEMIEYYSNLVSKYPIISIEDGLAEEDWEGWIKLTEKLGKKVQLTGDDIYVTNVNRIAKGIEINAGNSVLIKLNQIGTLTETFEAVELARKNGYTAVVSHRSGETADTFISHLVVGLSSQQIKTGAPCRVERIEKYNELLRIEEELGEQARYAGIIPFTKFLKG